MRASEADRARMRAIRLGFEAQARRPGSFDAQWRRLSLWYFFILGRGEPGYNRDQIAYVKQVVGEVGVRGASRVLFIPRRTVQRWARRHGWAAAATPSWVLPWAAGRRIKPAGVATLKESSS